MTLDVNTVDLDEWATTVERIKEALPGLKPTFKKIALYVLEDPQSVSFSSIQSLARQIEVNEAAIVRFTKSIGFTGYAAFKKTIQAAIKLQLNPYGEISMAELTSLAGARQLQKLMRFESDNVKKTLQAIKLPTVIRMIEGLGGCNRIFIAGFGATRCIAELYVLLLTSNFWKQVITINGSIADYIARLNLIEARDVLIIASLPPYTREDTQIARFARERGVKIYLFTDSPRCPVYPLSDEVILCSSTSLLYTNSYTGLITSFKVIMDMWLLSNQNESEARMKTLTDLELQGYKDLADASD